MLIQLEGQGGVGLMLLLLLPGSGGSSNVALSGGGLNSNVLGIMIGAALV